MSVYIQTISRGNLVKISFYRLIYLGSKGSGLAQADALVAQLDKDTLFEHVKRNIVATVTDGALYGHSQSEKTRNS